MKLVFALAVLIASITVFGATAQKSGIENELEELDLLIRLDQNNYALDGLVSKVRDALQGVLDRLKEKLAGKSELLQQFRAKIEEVQEKIRDLVKQGGARLAEAVNQIREKLQSLIKGVFDKINGLGSFYESEEQEQGLLQTIVQRLRELVQSGLDRLKERLAKYKDVFEQVKDRIAEIQEKLREVGKDFGIKALDKVAELRQKLRELIRDVTEKISAAIKGKESLYSYNGVEELPALVKKVKEFLMTEEGFQFIRNYARTVQSSHPIVNFVKLFINSQSDDYLKIVLAELFRDAYQAESFYALTQDQLATLTRLREILVTDAGIQRIRAFAKDLKSEHQIVNQVVGLLRAVPDAELGRVINELLTGLINSQNSAYEAEFSEGESLLELIGQRLRQVAQRALELLQERVSQLKEVGAALKEKIEVLKEQVKQLGKEAGQKAILLYQEIRKTISDILKGLTSKISGESALYEAEDEELPTTLVGKIVKRIRDVAQRALEKIKERLAPHKEFFDQVKSKIAEVQNQINQLGKVVGKKAVELVQSLRQKLQDLVKQVKDALKGSNYALIDDDDEEVDETNPSVISKLVAGIRRVVTIAMEKLQDTLATQKEIFAEFKHKIDEVNQGLLDLGKKTGLKALEAARALRQKIRDLNKAVINRLTGKGAFYEAELAAEGEEEEEQKVGLFTKIAERVRQLVQRAIEILKKNVSESKVLAAEFMVKLDAIATKLAEIAKKTGRDALDAANEVREKLSQLRKDIAQRIKEIIAGSLYAAEEDQSIGDHIREVIRQIVEKVKAAVQKVVEQAKEKLAQSKVALGEFKERIDEITQKLAEVGKHGASEALKLVSELRQKALALLRDVTKKITGQSFYETEVEIEEPESLVQRLVNRVRDLAQRVLKKVQDTIKNRQEIVDKVKDKISSIVKQIAELGKKHGQKALEAIQTIRQKLRDLVKDVASRILGEKTETYSLYADEEDQSIGDHIREVIRQIVEKVKAAVQKVVEQAKEKLAESKVALGEFKERIDEITQKLSEVGKHGVREALKLVSELRQKALALLRDVTKKITGQSFYETEVEIEEPKETLIQRLVNRIRDLAQRVLKRVQDAIKNRQEIVDKVKDKISSIVKQITELGKKHGQNALDAIQALRQKLRDLAKEVADRLNGGYSANYDAANLRDVIIKIRQTILNVEGVRRLKNYLNGLESTHPTLNLVRARVEASSDEQLLDILKGFFSGLDHIHLEDYPASFDNLVSLFRQLREEVLTDEGVAILKNYGKTIESNNPVVQVVKNALETKSTEAIKSFLSELFSGLTYRSSNYNSNNLRDVAVKLRETIIYAGGVPVIKSYLNTLKTEHPTVNMLRAHVEASSDEALLEIVKGLFSGLDYIILADYPIDIDNLYGLFREFSQEILTDEGIETLKNYAKTIESSIPVIQSAKIALETKSTEVIKSFLTELFSGLNFVYASELGDKVIERIRDQLLTDEGLDRLRTYARKVLPRHPLVITIKGYVLTSSDVELRELIRELLQDQGYYAGESDDLKTLMKSIKDFVLTNQGIEAVKVYFGNLQTSHPVVLRLKALVAQAENSVIREVATEILGNL